MGHCTASQVIVQSGLTFAGLAKVLGRKSRFSSGVGLRIVKLPYPEGEPMTMTTMMTTCHQAVEGPACIGQELLDLNTRLWKSPQGHIT